MNKLIEEMDAEISKFREMYLNKTITVEIAEEIKRRIINIAIEIYKDESIKFFIPLLEDGKRALYIEEEKRAYVPIFVDKNRINDDLIKGFEEITLKGLCDGLYENIRTYSDIDSINDDTSFAWLLEHIDEVKKMDEYSINNPRINGIMYEPFSNKIFGFEEWMVESVMFKGMGVTDCVWFNEKGEKQYEI